ncbi:tyrosine-type recombinase/integrase [Macrococcus carouselicus]|uniref:Tyr recombinase domain-containing protein n=1 Tax=Macrococcus carouselicus TaxID=69969 RepID=A0A9Q8CM92_9STAP|nr:tyrosine-type recombinase/integrase [Macrococcus carouselicus]TDM04021.1 hypothetical protein ERX40_02305 [Macrococcus carouselicus]
MLKVEPLKDVLVIERLKVHLRRRHIKYYLLFAVGINAPLKTEELVRLTVRDVKPPVFRAVNGFQIVLPDYLRAELDAFIQSENLQQGDHLFTSDRTGKPYTRQQLHRTLSEAAQALDIRLNIGMQSLKKTFAYHLYESGMDITDLQHLLGHQSKKMTYHFIDVPQLPSSCITLNL